LLALDPFSLGARVLADETGTAMADASRRLIAALDEKQKEIATFPFNSPERFNWHWIPRERKGLPFKAMTPEQRALAFGLLDTGLSTKGMLKATTIMSLEEILRIQEHGTGPVRDTELYFASVFGTPGDEEGWGWRIEGHHLALNFTLKGSRVISATPFMFGSNPAVVRTGSRKGLRNLEEIEAPVNELVLSLSADQRKLAVVSEEVPDVTVTPNSAQPPTIEPVGISSENLSSDQRKMLTHFVEAYYVNFPEPIRSDLHEQLARGAEKFHFAWFGPPDPTKPHAFRLQGPTLFIDFNEKQDEANHIHTFYRSLLGDFGQTSAQQKE
jgi:Protein of unknown function (DUF3500)